MFRKAGWRIKGAIPRGLPKAIWVVIPHHSNWDFLVGLGARAAIGMPIGFLAKKELFKWYTGWIFKGLGGVQVDRSRKNNLVAEVVRTFENQAMLHIAMAPEGTRKDVSKLKTGFYFIALQAGVPLILTGFDYPAREVVLSDPCHLTGDYERDMKIIYSFFMSIGGHRKRWLGDFGSSGRIS